MLTKIIDPSLIAQSKDLISNSESIVIVTHVGPDGDAMGSSLALYHFLRQLGKEQVTVVTPNKCPGFFGWMSGMNQVLVYENDSSVVDERIAAADLIIGVDFNSLSRIDRVGSLVNKSTAKKILIDHHLYPDDFVDVCISHPEVSSACELVFRFICRLGHFQEINQTIGECIYTGMMTDTGNFSYNSNRAEIYFIISELVKKGVDKDKVHNNVHNNHSVDRMRFLGYCLHKKMKILAEYSTAIITVSEKEMAQFNYRVGDLEGLVNYPLGIDGIVFSVFLREDKGRIKVSLRSKGDFPANKVAEDVFGGGGHLNASGAENYGTMIKTVNKLVKALPNYFNQ